MERKTFIKLVIAGALVEAGVIACNKNEYTVPVNDILAKTATITPPDTSIHTDKLYPTPTKTVIAVNTPEASPTPYVPFMFDGVDLATTKFVIKTTPELQKILSHIFPNNVRILTGDTPMPVTIPWWTTVNQNNIFENAAHDTSKGNPFYLYRTDLPNHYFLYFHSRLDKSPGDLSREVDALVIKNPGSIGDLIGQELDMTYGGLPVQAEIVNIQSMSGDFLLSSANWSVGIDNMIFARTDLLGIPEKIRNDKSPKVLYITLIGCQNPSGDIEIDLIHPGRAYANNGQDSSLLTVKVTFP